MSPVPSDDEVLTILREFLKDILPIGTPIILGQVNRTAEPHAADFVVMMPTRRARISTNVGLTTDVIFTGAISGNSLTVLSVQQGALGAGQSIFGSGVTIGTKITALAGGTGGTGSYTVTPSQSVGAQTMYAGIRTITQSTQLSFQIDVHGPASGNNAQTISTLLRDPYGTEFFAALNTAVSPLHADDPRQLSFSDGETQYEDRWIVEAEIQADQAVFVPQQFADSLVVDLISVDATYPS